MTMVANERSRMPALNTGKGWGRREMKGMVGDGRHGGRWRREMVETLHW